MMATAKYWTNGLLRQRSELLGNLRLECLPLTYTAITVDLCPETSIIVGI